MAGWDWVPARITTSIVRPLPGIGISATPECSGRHIIIGRIVTPSPAATSARAARRLRQLCSIPGVKPALWQACRVTSRHALANGAVEAFVRAAAIEVTQRVNAVSPTVFTESVELYGDLFAGFEPVPVRRAAGAYVRSIEGHQTGRVYEIG